MNAREYIASGILELYACNALSEEERAEVEAMASRHPDVAAELQAISDSLDALSSGLTVPPRPELKSRILDRLDEGERPLHTVRRGRAATVYIASLAASLVLLIISGLTAYLYYHRWQESRSELIRLQEEKDLLASHNRFLSSRMEEAAAMMRSPSIITVELKGTEKHPDAKAYVWWNPETSDVVIDPDSLPENSAGTQYQLWAIVDGQTVDAGTFDVSPREGLSFSRLKNISEAQAFAVTLEPRGGSPTPTLDQMLVIGSL